MTSANWPAPTVAGMVTSQPAVVTLDTIFGGTFTNATQAGQVKCSVTSQGIVSVWIDSISLAHNVAGLAGGITMNGGADKLAAQFRPTGGGIINSPVFLGGDDDGAGNTKDIFLGVEISSDGSLRIYPCYDGGYINFQTGILVQPLNTPYMTFTYNRNQ